jgi:hypothetical protein
MPDEVAGNHSDLLALGRALLERQQEVDDKLATDAHAAVKDALMLQVLFLKDLSCYLAAPLAPRAVPGAALVRLLAAHDDLESGIVDPVLHPKATTPRGGNKLSLMARLERVPLAVSMQLLMQAGRLREAAAKEVVQMLGNRRTIFAGHGGSPWRLVARWRDELGEDPDLKQMLNNCVAEIAAPLKDRQDVAEALVRAARIALDRYE